MMILLLVRSRFVALLNARVDDLYLCWQSQNRKREREREREKLDCEFRVFMMYSLGFRECFFGKKKVKKREAFLLCGFIFVLVFFRAQKKRIIRKYQRGIHHNKRAFI